MNIHITILSPHHLALVLEDAIWLVDEEVIVFFVEEVVVPNLCRPEKLYFLYKR